MVNDDKERLLDIHQAAEYVGTTANMLKMYANTRFKACRGFGVNKTRVGNKPYFSIQDLDDFIEAKIASFRCERSKALYCAKIGR